MPHFLRTGRKKFRPEKFSAFQLFGRNYDFGFIFARKTGFMPQLGNYVSFTGGIRP